jgi:hypothetical protein
MKEYREQAISWLLHSMKILLGDESIRRYIILKYNPTIKNKAKTCIRTFNAFIPRGKTRSDKANQIVKFCDKMLTKKGTVVFTATNIQRNSLDNETHYQSYILDNDAKKIIIVDPAYDRTKENGVGIYMAEVSNEVIIPFFTSKGYAFKFVYLTKPAQICEDDVFCQSWSLYILLEKLKNNVFVHDVSFEIPEDQLDKYDMLLEFYKKIFADMPELISNLQTEYCGELAKANGPEAPKKNQKKAMMQMNAVELLLGMSKHDMK